VNPFANNTPVSFFPPGYQPDLDRIPPSGGTSCLRLIIIIIVGIIILIGVGAGAVMFIASRTTGGGITTQPITPRSATLSPMDIGNLVLSTVERERTNAPTATASPTSTLDAWSNTGTAIFLATHTATATASATMDYCAYLTPTASPSPTAIYTMDAWQVTGTAIYHETQTPTTTPTITPTAPRAWCDLALDALAYTAAARSATPTRNLTLSPVITTTAPSFAGLRPRNIATAVTSIIPPKSRSSTAGGMNFATRPAPYAPIIPAAPKMSPVRQRTRPARACGTSAAMLVVPTTSSDMRETP